MQLFTINNTDYTKFIEVPSYKVNCFDVADEWTDGDRVKHKHIVRTQIKGTFKLKFMEVSDFNEFFRTITQNKIQTGDYSGTVICSVYVNNKDEVSSGYFFIDADPKDEAPVMGGIKWEGFEVTIEEA